MWCKAPLNIMQSVGETREETVNPLLHQRNPCIVKITKASKNFEKPREAL